MKLNLKLEGLENIRKFSENEQKIARVGFSRAAYFLFTKSQEIVAHHTVTGHLGGSGKVELGDFSAELVWTVSHAAYLQGGTRPHIIKPRRKLALRFKVEGGQVFAKLVHHPGTKPVPFAYGYTGFDENVLKANEMIVDSLKLEWEGIP